jgi:DNA processing protein
MALIELTPGEYPVNLREIPDPPAKLWLRGTLPPAHTKMLTVVGSRALSSYGREACEMLISGLRGFPISVVSGLALGADACAHKAALAAGLHTIAIPGSGLGDDVIGPRSNLRLAHEILNKGGALLSESEPDHIAAPYDFPSRNRIMAGLADAILIIEAGKKSGTLITCKYASDYNRELLCVPHRIGDPHGHAAEIFLRLGATYVTHPHHILEALRIPIPEDPSELPLPDLTPDEKKIYDLLETSHARDELLRMSGFPAHISLTLLMSLELKGVICEQFGVWRRT